MNKDIFARNLFLFYIPMQHLQYFFLKTNERIGFLISENIRIDILFMSLAYVVAKLFVNMVFLYALAAILDFAILDILSTNPFFS